jgi:hypothetical protein
VTGFLPTFLLSCVRAVLLVINCLLLNDRHCQCDGGLPTGPGQFKWPTSWKGDPARLGRVLRDFGSGHPAGAPSKVYL